MNTNECDERSCKPARCDDRLSCSGHYSECLLSNSTLYLPGCSLGILEWRWLRPLWTRLKNYPVSGIQVTTFDLSFPILQALLLHNFGDTTLAFVFLVCVHRLRKVHFSEIRLISHHFIEHTLVILSLWNRRVTLISSNRFGLRKLFFFWKEATECRLVQLVKK